LLDRVAAHDDPPRARLKPKSDKQNQIKFQLTRAHDTGADQNDVGTIRIADGAHGAGSQLPAWPVPALFQPLELSCPQS
jgi:hypothetical protein